MEPVCVTGRTRVNGADSTRINGEINAQISDENRA